MAILKTDVKIFKSELLTDADNAGGRRTGMAVVDGEANNLFPDVSRIDRVYGKVNLRKIFTGVATDDTQPWLGAHAVLLAPPANPRVRALLFSTDSASDTRLNAKDRVEAYLAQGGDTGWLLYGNHYKGQRAVTFLLRTTDLLPQIGFTYVLLDNAGAGVGLTEYVRVYDLTVVSRTFTTFEQGAERTFTRNIATVDIGIPLSRDWGGNDALFFYNGITIESKVLSTLVADAARYYGIAPLDTAVTANTREVQLESLFENLVPASRSETPLLDLRAVGDQGVTISSGVQRSISTAVAGLTNTHTIYFGRGINPKSLSGRLYRNDNANFDLRYVDNGLGGITVTLNVNNSLGTINLASSFVDYETGQIFLQTSSSFNFTNFSDVTATPAVNYTDVGHTDAIDITQANRQFNYTRTLLPPPTPRSLSVSYRALGQWYRLRDDGAGQLVPDVAGTGTGTINYATGSAVLTTAAYPDDESAVIWQWGSGVSLARRDGASATFNGLEIDQVVTAGTAMNPGSLQISYLSGGAARVVTDNPDGSLTGNNSGGYVAFGTGRVVFRPNPLPDPNSLITYTYEDGGALTDSVMGASFTLSVAPVKAGTVVMQVPVISQTNDGRLLIFSVKELRDDGTGNLKNGSTNCGTVNYSTGAVTLNIAALTYKRRDYSITANIWQPFLNEAYAQDAGAMFNVSYLSNAAPLTSRSTQIACPPLSIDVTPDISDTVVPDSLLFTFGGVTYLDREGSIYRNVNALTNAGTLAGTINYETGAVTLTNWAVGSNTATVNAMLTRFGDYHVDEIAFRTAATPLLPGLQVRATTLEGDQVIAEADNNGAITGDFTGTLDVDAGVVLLDFGSFSILPDTVRYTGVATKNLPLEAKLLGLNPVRLPPDGRVPLFRVGDLALLHHTALTVLPNPVMADTDYALGRTNIDDVEVRDALGVLVADMHYMVDLVIGEITFPALLDLSAYTQPLTVHNRIEFTGLVDDVQINGLIHFNSDIPRAFPLGSYVSGILPFGDLQAASPVFFDQTTWASTWADVTTGAATANYNTIVYPIQLKNTHAVTERWALVFTSSTAFNIIGETLGVVGTGNTSTTVAPVNPFTGQPYFTLLAAGFGAGWATNNAIRFNTTASFAPVWVARTILSGSAEYTEDGFRIQARGDSN